MRRTITRSVLHVYTDSQSISGQWHYWHGNQSVLSYNAARRHQRPPGHYCCSYNAAAAVQPRRTPLSHASKLLTSLLSLSLSDRQELAAWTFTQQHSIYYSASQTGSRLCVWDAFSCHLAGLHLNFYSLASPRTLNTLHAWSNCHFSTSLYY